MTYIQYTAFKSTSMLLVIILCNIKGKAYTKTLFLVYLLYECPHIRHGFHLMAKVCTVLEVIVICQYYRHSHSTGMCFHIDFVSCVWLDCELQQFNEVCYRCIQHILDHLVSQCLWKH